jgi:hypothetical protein
MAEGKRKEKLKPHECPAGPEWIQKDAATADSLAGWSVNGQPLPAI